MATENANMKKRRINVFFRKRPAAMHNQIILVLTSTDPLNYILRVKIELIAVLKIHSLSKCITSLLTVQRTLCKFTSPKTSMSNGNREQREVESDKCAKRSRGKARLPLLLEQWA